MTLSFSKEFIDGLVALFGQESAMEQLMAVCRTSLEEVMIDLQKEIENAAR